MATVVNRRGSQYGELLLGALAGFLTGLKNKRLDKQQSGLMQALAEAPDEATAAALYGDPQYQDVVSDPERFPKILQAASAMQPGFDTHFGYTPDGEQVPFSVRKGTEINAETFSTRGLRAEKSKIFYVDDLDKDEDIPTVLGRFETYGQARDAYAAENPDANFSVLEQAEANIASQAATLTGGQRRAEVQTYLAEERFRVDQAKGFTPFANLEYDFAEGKIDQKFYEAAKARLTFTSGLTPDDIAQDYQATAAEDYANVESMSQLFKIMTDNAVADPRILTDIAAIPRVVARVGAELSAIALSTGMTRKSIDEYDWGSLAVASNVHKGMILDAAMVSAKADDQTARSLSDKDLDRFLDRVGRNISDVPSFVANLRSLAQRQQRGFHIRHRAFTRQEWAGAPFTQIVLDPATINAAFLEELRQDPRFPGLKLPGDE